MSDKMDLSSYSIQKKWIEEVAPNYFNVDDISMLRTGLFGYVNDAMSNAFEDSLHMQTILSKEIFPNKAVLPDSIYAYSALADFTDFYAKGAVVPIVMTIPTKDIIKFATKNNTNGNIELVISRFSELLVDNKVPFIFDYDIKIIGRYSKDGYIFSAQYIINEKNELSSISSPFINTVTLKNDFFLRIEGRQLLRTTRNFMIYSNDVAENFSFEADYEGRLAGFNVYYRSNSYNGKYELIDKHLVNSVVDSNSSKFCYYNMSATDRVVISFPTNPSYFRPAFNSEILIEIFTTLGEDGNFEYNGENNTLNLKSTDETKDLSAMNAFANVMGDSMFGANEPSLQEIKQKVMKEFSSRKNIITELDLKNYFEGKTGNSNIYFCKKRDDLIKRMYTAFLLLRNSSKEIIPTNTVDIMIRQDQFDNYVKENPVLTLRAGSIFEGCQGMDVFRKVDGKYDWQTLIQKDSNLVSTYPGRDDNSEENINKTNYLYGTPYLIKVNTKPLFMSYYLNSIKDQIVLAYNDMDPNSYEEFIMTNLEVERNAVKEDFYTLKTHVNTTVDFSQMFNTFINANGRTEVLSYNPNSSNTIKLYGVLEEDGEVTGYIKFDPYLTEGNTIHFKCELKTDDYISSRDEINLIHSVFATSSNIENLRANFSLSNDRVKLHLCVYYNGYSFSNKIKFAKQIPELDEFTLCNIYTSEKNLQLFKNLNTVMDSQISLCISEDKTKPGYYYRIKKVPLVRYMYMEAEENMNEIIDILSEMKELLMRVIPDMENNFTLDSKFYNTYGESKYFTIGRHNTALDMTSISIKLNVKLNKEVSADLVDEIKNFIVNFVENTNNDNFGYIYVSNLTRVLEQNFEEINYIEFVGFNDYDSSYQIIENNLNLNEMTQEQVINYVPEYLNINRHIILDSGELIFEPRIFLNFI